MQDNSQPDLSRTALYARYSTDRQERRSIRDQLRECRAKVEAMGGRIVGEWFDAGRSGSTVHGRAGLLALLDACRAGGVTTVCAEALDRISRNQADIAAIFRRLRFDGISILTLEEGEVELLHVGLKGIMGELYLEAVRQKTRRGQVGVLADGRTLARVTYGYRLANRLEGAKLVRGLREVVPEEAAAVRRIYARYAQGVSARAIAAELNAVGTPPPGGASAWHHRHLLRGRVDRGILRNPIYAGRIEWNRESGRRDPETGRKTTRRTDPREWVRGHMPHLRIIPDALWDVVQARIERERRPRPTAKGQVPRPGGAGPLTRLLHCSRCRGPVRAIARGRYGCRRALDGEGCDAPTFSLGDLEGAVAERLGAWVRRRRDWRRILEVVQSHREERRRHIESEIAEKEVAVGRLVAAIEGGGGPAEAIQRRIVELEREVGRLRRELEAMPGTPGTDTAGWSGRIEAQVVGIAEAAGGPEGEARRIAVERVGGMLERITIGAGPKRGGVRMRIRPNLPEIVRLADVKADHAETLSA